MKIQPQAFTFDDVLLVPQYSSILPAQTSVTTHLTKNIKLAIPILSAAMDTVTNVPLACSLALHGGLGILHRHLSIQEQIDQVIQVKSTGLDANHSCATKDKKGRLAVGAAVGTDHHSQERVIELANAGIDAIVIDTAHGHSQLVFDMVAWIKNQWPDLPVIAGNIVTSKAAQALAQRGADAVKVGIGPGAACTTRLITGAGYPQLSALMQVADALSNTDVKIIADGGIRNSGDLTKALAAGAHTVMLGQILAATDEAPGTLLIENGKTYKTYRGMHSKPALQDKHSIQDPHFKQSQQKFVAEGAHGKILYKGSLADVLFQMVGGLRSGMGYLGCATILDLHEKAEFVRISPSCLSENQPHGLC